MIMVVETQEKISFPRLLSIYKSAIFIFIY